ncbi:MAG: DUF3426 domain-containing protein, partial [Deltaproteobacteria bacterium]|nr:DUF3426 domain-containing protein [Deltaproteobacteria bacterium]
ETPAQAPTPPAERYEEEFIGKEETPPETTLKRRIPLLSRRIILLLFLLLVAGGAGVFYLQGGVDIISNLWAPKEVAGGKLDIVGLKHYFVENPSAGRLFVVEGKVTSTFEGAREIAGIKGTLLDDKGKQLQEKKVSPGRVISGEELKAITKEDLEKRFKEILKGSIPPKGSIPFMIVFQNPPMNLAEFTVEETR